MRADMRWGVVVGATVLWMALTAGSCHGARELLDVALDRPVVLVSGGGRAFLKVTLTGVDMPEGRRAPANVAIVLDRSGSMQGEKLERAKEAAIMAIDRLGPEDIVSVVVYDDTVQVLLPATRVSDRRVIREAIESIEAGDSTALFAGVSKGAAEVRKFLDRELVNRVILVSDGLANVGPDSPVELGALGASLKKEGISVSTIGLGLGYNEDLMSRLADRSDGNHAFVEEPRDLARIFDSEFGDLLSVAAKELVVRIDCGAGVRPIRVLGREAEISGGAVLATLGQVYDGQEKYVLVELELPRGRDGERLPVATVTVDYLDLQRGARQQSRRGVDVRFTSDRALAERSENGDVVVAVVEQVATERNELALALRDQGRVDEAEAALLTNVRYIDDAAQRYDSDRLRSLAQSNEESAQKLDDESWNATRKQMREVQQVIKQQQNSPPPPEDP